MKTAKFKGLPVVDDVVVGAWEEIQRVHKENYKHDPAYRKRYLENADRMRREQTKGNTRLFTKGGKRLQDERDSIPGFTDWEPELRVRTAIQNALYTARDKAGLSQSQLAKKMGMLQPAVSRIENAANLSLKSLSDYLAACSCTIEIKVKKLQ